MDFNKQVQMAEEELDWVYKSEKPVVLVGSATCGNSAGAEEVASIIQEECIKNDIECSIVKVGCIGLCYAEPSHIRLFEMLIYTREKINAREREEREKEVVIGRFFSCCCLFVSSRTNVALFSCKTYKDNR